MIQQSPSGAHISECADLGCGLGGKKRLGQEHGLGNGRTVEMLAETAPGMSPASPRYQAGLRDHIRKQFEGRVVYRG